VRKVAKRLDCARFSGAFVRPENPGKRMISARSNSGAKATAVQTLRDQRIFQSQFDFENMA
jgi:hypothetical protein